MSLRTVEVKAVIVLLGIHAALLSYAATRHSPTLNEPGHLVAGLSHWQFGRFEVYRVNPPLVHYVAAIPVILAGYEEDWSGFDDSPGARPEFKIGEDFVRANGERSIWLFVIARWACIPFSLAGGLFCFFWSRELWESNSAGLISLFLWCFEPNILAHGELITSDCAATSLGLGAGYMFWRWLRKPVWRRALAAGLVLGLAELTKSIWVILFVLWPFLWLFWRWTERRANRRNEPSGAGQQEVSALPPNAGPPTLNAFYQLAVILFLGVYILNIGYGFDGTFTRLKNYTFVSKSLTGLEKAPTPGNRFAESWMGELPLPVPRQYLQGIDLQRKDFEDNPQPCYLRGEWKKGGWWYYYLYGLAVKTPHGTQIMLLLATFTVVFVWVRGSASPSSRTGAGGRNAANYSFRDLVILLTPALTVLVLVSSQLEFNHHVRYVLPVLGFIFVFIGVTAYWVSPPHFWNLAPRPQESA